MARKLNKYDIYVVILIASLASGQFGGALQLSRALSILLIPILLRVYTTLPKVITRRPKQFVVIILFWSIISLLWTGSFERGLQECVYFIVHMFYFLEIIVFTYKSQNKLLSVSIGWAIAVLVTSSIALWEIQTGQHLSTGRFEEDILLYTGFARRFASATFFNFNDYEVFLCYSIPFILFAIYSVTDFKKLVFFFFVLLCAVTITCFNASRGAAISALTMVFIGLWGALKQNSMSKIPLILLLFVFVFFLYEFSDEILLNLTARLDTTSAFESDRTEIWYLAFLCLLNTGLMGTGIAGIETGMSVVSNHYLAVHNLFVEILVEFGIFIFFYIVSILFKMFLYTLRGKTKYKRIILSTFLVLPFIFIVSSKFLLCPDLYAFISSFYILVYHDKFA
ncbi:MAG: O-antigen ligase family protein [Bacteroidaceae bacterium]|nr:O-antigen ligase family protein [Bacteroidaceae bacterium]